MRILFISEKLPYPLDTGGNIRSYHVLKALSMEHQVTLLTTVSSPSDRRHLKSVEQLGINIWPIETSIPNIFQDFSRLLQSVFTGKPFVLYRHFDKDVADRISGTLKKKYSSTMDHRKGGNEAYPFDAVHFNHLDAALYANCIPPNVLKFLDQHNIVTNQIMTTIQNEDNRIRRLILNTDLGKVREFEIRACRQMDCCFVCSATDYSALKKMSEDINLVTLPNGVDLNYFSIAKNNMPKRYDMVFVGTMDYDPCEKGIFYFLNEILPLIQQNQPEVKIAIIGRNPSDRLIAMAKKNKHIELTGRVSDIRPYVYGSRVFFVPLLSGSGTRLKILEAMAMGIPVVSTSIGAEGINLTDGKDILIGDSPEQFATCVGMLLKDQVLADSIKTRARSLVESRYGWDRISTELLDTYRNIKGQY